MKHKITGDISSWNNTIYDFKNKMRQIKADEELELEINSYGGDVFAGIDLMNTLRGHQGNVTLTITGIAASAASIIAMGADTIRMYSNTQLMVHNAWTIVAGNAKDLRKKADDLDSIGESVLASYTHRVDAKTVEKLLNEETYLSAEKAKELGFIDEIVDGNVETVDSEIFQDKAETFNNSITLKPVKNTITVDVNAGPLKEILEGFQNQINEMKNQNMQQTNEPIPTQVVAKKPGFIF